MKIDWLTTAGGLGHFIRQFRNQDTFGAPAAGKHNAFRGTALVNLDQIARNAIDILGDIFDKELLLHVWKQALDARPWNGPPLWIHGGILAPNIIVRNGNIEGIIDFGLMCIGDPRCDLAPAWSYVPPFARDRFRAAADVDEAMWQRGKG